MEALRDSKWTQFGPKNRNFDGMANWVDFGGGSGKSGILAVYGGGGMGENERETMPRPLQRVGKRMAQMGAGNGLKTVKTCILGRFMAARELRRA